MSQDDMPLCESIFGQPGCYVEYLKKEGSIRLDRFYGTIIFSTRHWMQDSEEAEV